MAESKKLLVIGAGGATGSSFTDQAVTRGHKVRAAERSWPGDIAHRDGVSFCSVDILKDELEPEIEGMDAVVSCIGVEVGPKTAVNPPPLYTEGVLRITQAMKTTGVRRLVVISATFVETLDRGPVWFRAAARLSLTQVFRDMGNMERVLRATDGIDWTAVRPGWLYDAPATGDYTVTGDVIPDDMVRTRIPDLAGFMLDCVERDLWIRGTPAISRPEPAAATSPFEVLKEAVAG